MRRYVRFMGVEELAKYQEGTELVSEVQWDRQKNSTSVGFCFFDDSVDPAERMEYLNGIVDMYAVAVFEPIKPVRFRLSKGIYRDPKRDQPQTIFEAFNFANVACMPVKEYSLTSYSKGTLKLVQLGKPILWYQSEKQKNWIDWRAYEQS